MEAVTIEVRVLEILEEILLIHSPSRHEGQMTQYLIKFIDSLGGDLFLDENQNQYGGDSPVIFARFPGTIPGQVTLNAHTDVIEPNHPLQIVKEDDIWRSDGTTTLGADDKAGLAAILTAVEFLVSQSVPHQEIFLVLTPSEEVGMLGARHIQWSQVFEKMNLAKNMIVVDNAGPAKYVAYQAPTAYQFSVNIYGKKAHAGIEPNQGLNAIQQASQIINQLPLLRINNQTTANISYITSDFPSNVVPDFCQFGGEIRCQTDQGVQEIIKIYQEIIEKYVGQNYLFEYSCNYPTLNSQDNLSFAKEIIQAYQSIGVEAETQIIRGGSDANFFAQAGFNPVIIGAGIMDMHTNQEYLVLSELFKTTAMLINYISH